MKLRLIISGGQTGADRGGLNYAIKNKIPHGGFCPLGRRAEDGQIPREYRLIETDSTHYTLRTELNVLAAEATLLVFREPMGAGSRLTTRYCLEHRRLLLPVAYHPQTAHCHIERVAKWLAEIDVAVLNVAGSRESKAPGIQAYVPYLLERAGIILAHRESPV